MLNFEISVLRQVSQILFSEGPFVLSRLIVNKIHNEFTKRKNNKYDKDLASCPSSALQQLFKISHNENSKVIGNRSYYIATKNGAAFDQEAIREVLHNIANELKKELKW